MSERIYWSQELGKLKEFSKEMPFTTTQKQRIAGIIQRLHIAHIQEQNCELCGEPKYADCDKCRSQA